MIKITFCETDIEALRYWRCHPLDPRSHVRMEAIYVRSQRVANRDIPRLCVGFPKRASIVIYTPMSAAGSSS
jgi:hypothetical protein